MRLLTLLVVLTAVFTLSAQSVKEHLSLVKDINIPPEIDNKIKSITDAGTVFYFTHQHHQYGEELWISDGTKTGTHIVKDIVPGSGSSSPNNLMIVGEQLFFVSGHQLWITDGTEGGYAVSKAIC